MVCIAPTSDTSRHSAAQNIAEKKPRQAGCASELCAWCQSSLLAPSPPGLSFTHIVPPPVWGRMQVGGKPALVQHPHPGPPPSRGRETMPREQDVSLDGQAHTEMWAKHSARR
jgi:hypothetical protein